ncbi:hypothetical protein JCM17823_20730 [Halorubrum gandharaense]
MQRRALLAVTAAGAFPTLAGCLDGVPGAGDGGDGDGGNGDDHAVDEDRIESCALTVVEPDVEADREDPAVERVGSPSAAVVETTPHEDRVVYTVEVRWSVDESDRRVVTVEPAADPEPPDDATTTEDEAFADAPLLQETIFEAVDTGESVRFDEFNDGYDDAMAALADVFGREPDDDPLVIDHDGTAVAITARMEPGLHADKGRDLELFAVDGTVYQAVDQPAGEAPVDDGTPIDC